MRAHYLQHVPFEGLGSIAPWLQQAGYNISSTQLYNSEALPDLTDIDFLIVMGGPMSVNDYQQYPWLEAEQQFIQKAVKSDLPVLGICLGAQLIASAMGAKVYPQPEKEIGWFPVKAIQPKLSTVFQFPDDINAFHWHGETFTLPKAAIHIAKSEACENQAFQIGTKTIGLQFHLETTLQSAQALVDNCGDELVEAKYIQTEDTILSAPEERFLSINRLMGCVLNYLHTNHA